MLSSLPPSSITTFLLLPQVLIFSQFVGVLEMLADYFSHRGTSVLGDYRLLMGDTPGPDRDAYIREFNNDPNNEIFAFLLSTRAGGLGINLCAADTVIFYDSDWNPKSDEQVSQWGCVWLT